MANKIIIKRTSTPDKEPLVGDIDLGELAINTYGGRLYAKKNDGSASIVDLTANDTVSLSGDATGSGKTSIAVTLANTAVSAGVYGNVESGVVKVPRITVDSKGRITDVQLVNFSAAANLGNIATQNENNISISGGNIDGTTIGSTTRAAGYFTALTTTNDVTVGGNLYVQGTTTTVNSTTVAIGDLNLELAKDATTAAAANGGGITIHGPATPATFTYANADDSWNVNKKLKGTVANFTTSVTTGNISAGNLTVSNLTATQIAFAASDGSIKGDAALVYDELTSTLTLGNLIATGASFSAKVSITDNTLYATGVYNTGSLSVAGDVSFASNVQVQQNIRAAGTIYKAGHEVLSVIDTIDGGTY